MGAMTILILGVVAVVLACLVVVLLRMARMTLLRVRTVHVEFTPVGASEPTGAYGLPVARSSADPPSPPANLEPRQLEPPPPSEATEAPPQARVGPAQSKAPGETPAEAPQARVGSAQSKSRTEHACPAAASCSRWG